MVANEMNSGFGSVPSINGSVYPTKRFHAKGRSTRRELLIQLFSF